MDTTHKNLLIYGGIGLAIYLAFARDIAKAIAKTAVSTVVKTAEGVVVGIGEGVGIPETDAAKCEAAINAGELWNSSLYCPAGTFLKSAAGIVWNPATGEKVGQSQPTGTAEVIQITAPQSALDMGVPF